MKSSAIVAAAAFTSNVIAQNDAGFVLPKLPYAYDALEPFIDAKTVEIHYDKHHRSYVSNLNKLLAGNKDLMKMDINQLVSNISKVPEAIRQGVTNNAGGNANHIFICCHQCMVTRNSKMIAIGNRYKSTTCIFCFFNGNLHGFWSNYQT